jgi:hypothetical protein
LKVATDYRKDDDNWWVSLTFPEGGASITLTTFHENVKPGTMTLYFATSDVAAAHKELSDKSVKVNEVKDAPWFLPVDILSLPLRSGLELPRF